MPAGLRGLHVRAAGLPRLALGVGLALAGELLALRLGGRGRRVLITPCRHLITSRGWCSRSTAGERDRAARIRERNVTRDRAVSVGGGGGAGARLKWVRTLFGAAVSSDVIRRSPCVGIKLPEVVATTITPLTATQVEALADAIDPRCRALVLLGYGCGLRVSEALGLTEPNVSWFTREVAITQQLGERRPYPLVPLKNSKRRPSRVVPMPQHVHAALSRHIEVYGLGERDLVFTGASGGPMAQATVGRSFRRACRQVGLGDSVTYPCAAAQLRQRGARTGVVHRRGRRADRRLRRHGGEGLRPPHGGLQEAGATGAGGGLGVPL